MGLASEWVRSLSTQKEMDDFEEVLRNSTMVCDRLLAILDEWEAELDSKDVDFATPNWEYQQAARIGDRRRIRKLRDLFSFRKPKVN